MDNLLSWWKAEFTPEEQNYILSKLSYGEDLDLERIIRPDGSLGLIGSLANLATWFTTEKDLLLARRILAKSVEMQESENGSLVDRHFTYHNMIRVYYRDRNRDENTLELAIQACEKQIALAPQLARNPPRDWVDVGLPEPTGFKQLAIILQQNKDYEGAIRLSEEALRQRWAGDWEKRIARCKRRSSQQRR